MTLTCAQCKGQFSGLISGFKCPKCGSVSFYAEPCVTGAPGLEGPAGSLQLFRSRYEGPMAIIECLLCGGDIEQFRISLAIESPEDTTRRMVEASKSHLWALHEEELIRRWNAGEFG